MPLGRTLFAVEVDGGQITVKNTSGLRPPWKPGESGNPGGRPKKKPLTRAYEQILDDPEEAAAVARGVVHAAKSGDVPAARELADRVEGAVVRRTAETDTEGNDLDNLDAARALVQALWERRSERSSD